MSDIADKVFENSMLAPTARAPGASSGAVARYGDLEVKRNQPIDVIQQSLLLSSLMLFPQT